MRVAARELLAASVTVSPPTIEEAYVLPQFGDWPFAFTRIDAMYVWTRGGYQVGRDPADYPLFLAIREQATDAWEGFFDSFGLSTALERQPRESVTGPVQIVLEPRSVLEIEDGRRISSHSQGRNDRIYARKRRPIPVSPLDARSDVRGSRARCRLSRIRASTFMSFHVRRCSLMERPIAFRSTPAT